MGYLDALPSLEAVKGFANRGYEMGVSSYQFASEQVKTYYPVIKEAGQDYSGRAVKYVQSKALEYPAATLVTFNTAFVLAYEKMIDAASGVFNYAVNKELANQLAKVVTIGVGGAANYLLFKTLDVSLQRFGLAVLGGGAIGYLALGVLERKRATYNAKLGDAVTDCVNEFGGLNPLGQEAVLKELLGLKTVRRMTEISERLGRQKKYTEVTES